MPEYDKESLQQLHNLKTDERLKKLEEWIEDASSELIGFEGVDLYYRKRLEIIEQKIELLEKDRHTHLPSQLEPKGEVEGKAIVNHPKSYPLSDWIKNKFGL